MGDQENRTLGDHGNERNNRSDNKQSIKQYSKTRLCPARRRIDQIELYLVWIYWKTPEIPKSPPVCSSNSGRIARFHNLPDRPASTASHHAIERSRVLLTKNARLCSSPRVHARPPPVFSRFCVGVMTPLACRDAPAPEAVPARYSYHPLYRVAAVDRAHYITLGDSFTRRTGAQTRRLRAITVTSGFNDEKFIPSVKIS